MDKRRESLKKLLDARMKYFSQLRDPKIPDLSYDRVIDGGEFLDIGETSEVFHDLDILEEILRNLEEKPTTLEDLANKINDEGIGLSYDGLYLLFEAIPEKKSMEFLENDAIYKFISEKRMPDVEMIEMLGEAYGKLGIQPDKLPEIGIRDTSFLSGYLCHFPKKEDNIIKKENPEYKRYIEMYNLVERAQSELDLRYAKKEQVVLKGRTQKIAEAEALVDQQQGQQQE